MTVAEVAKELNMNILTGDAGLDKEITGVYIGDLLSWVISHSKENNLWITVLTNLNVVAVALLTDAACIVLPEGITAENATIEKAKKEGIPILSSELAAYEISILFHEKCR